MDKAFGTQFKFFRTKGDTLFNAMRQGQRYRIRTINGITEKGLPTVTVLDVFCDSIDLRHKIDVKDSFVHVKENLYTIGLEYLILSKSQFIMDFPKADIHLLREKAQEFRILPYEWYSSEKLVLGMEEKDARDTCAIFLDHPVGTGKGEINSEKVRKVLEKDRKLALTATLNLQNLMDRTDLMKKWLEKDEVATIVDRIQALLKVLPKVDKKWDKPWWNTAVETPLIG
jgi:predicted nucleic acid-binding protein